MRIWRNIVVLWCIYMLVACSAPTMAPTDQKPTVIATFSILADVTSRIGADVLDVTSIIPVDGDAHVYEPTPADGVRLAQATTIVQLGLGYEPWFERLFTASASKATVIVASQNVITHTSNNEIDPHIWHDVRRTMQMVETISAGLVAQYPAFASQIQRNTQAYLAELYALDSEIVADVATLPQAKRLLVTNHDTFAYFAERYGFTIIGTALGSASTDGSDPGATAVVALSDAIRAAGVPAIFVENIANTQIMEQIAQTAGVVIAPPLYTDALGDAGSAGAHYIDMMRYNVRTIVQALSKSTP